ncbi:MAG: hypothetical protein HYR67_12435 [Bacteroidetes bacterium]|nr:hypothetical protein [Bacteroidota bacterium]
MQKFSLKTFLLLGSISVWMFGCNRENVSSTNTGLNQTILLAVGQTSAQLASGASFSIVTSSTSGNVTPAGSNHHPGHCPNDGMGSFLEGTNFLTPTNELIAIVDAESAGDMRGLRMYANGGAKITNYNASGNVVTLTAPSMNKGPEGASFSCGQFPQNDSLLSKIVKTEIDFGGGVTIKHDTITITRAGKIIITRSKSGQARTETITFQNYSVNNNTVEGTKIRTSTFDSSTGNGQSITTVSDGKITFSDGTVATWVSSRERDSQIVLDSVSMKPSSGTIVTTASISVTSSNGEIYSHVTTKAVKEDLSCGREHHWPVSGTIETKYRSNDVVVDFGDGSCSNKTISITINGVTTTKTIGI